MNLWNVPAGTLAFDLQGPGSTAFPTSGVNRWCTQCNSAFAANYSYGGSLTTGGSSAQRYQGAAAGINGGCLNDLGNLAVPTLNDVSRNLQEPQVSRVEPGSSAHVRYLDTVVSANYVGNHGYDGLIFNDDLNGFGFGQCFPPRLRILASPE